MLYKTYVFCFLLLIVFVLKAQTKESIYSFSLSNNVTITIDEPVDISTSRKAVKLILYALPNGNSTAQTMGKKMEVGDDWHFNIQHIKAQTQFLRNRLTNNNIVIAYLENSLKSWPAWKQQNPNHLSEIKNIVDTIASLYRKPHIYLNGHSGGGSFIFGYLKSVLKIPKNIYRISFLDSNYGYDSTYTSKLVHWLKNKKHSLNIFAYNDSVALYNEKPVVSATGGTWYRSHLMLTHFSEFYSFNKTKDDSLTFYKSKNKRIQFFFKQNLDRKIYHTHQVELNGFIHSILCGTPFDSKNYTYYGERAYSSLIQ